MSHSVSVGKLSGPKVTSPPPNQPLRAPRMKATKTTQPRVDGMRTFQPKRMNWSYRTRGSEPRSQTKTNMNSHSLTVNHSTPHQPLVEHAVADRRDPGRGLPAAEEHRRRERRDGEHVDVLAEEEHREPHRGVLGVEARDDLALALGEVERQPVGLTDHRDDVDEEAEERRDGVPQRCLRPDDLRGRHRAAVEEDGDEREAHGDLVGDHLRGGAQPAHERVRRARGPAGEDDAVDARRRRRRGRGARRSGSR